MAVTRKLVRGLLSSCPWGDVSLTGGSWSGGTLLGYPEGKGLSFDLLWQYALKQVCNLIQVGRGFLEQPVG
jgi:hypothetical protein